MTLFLQNARLIDPEALSETLGNVVIDAGKIAAIGDMSAPADAEVIDCDGKCLAPGIVDLGVKIGEPGERHMESFRSAALAAAAGGVTTIVARPDTAPAIDTPETLEFVTRRAADAPVRILHMAALTKGRDGQEMTEIGFLKDAGALAFTDVTRVSDQTRALQRAYTYAAHLGALVIGHPQDPGLSQGAAVTSGKFASLRGLPGVSPMAERIGLERDLALVEMTGLAYHADQITTAKALPALARAKAAGLDVTAGVSIHHLTLNALDVGDYRTFFKLTPPLRDEDDRLAVIAAVADGTIDVICSMHTPADEESKRLPFEEAASGAVRSGNPAACRDAALSRRATEPAAAVSRPVPEPCAPSRTAPGAALRWRTGRSRSVRSGRALRARPFQIALEIQEYTVRYGPHGRQNTCHFRCRRAGL